MEQYHALDVHKITASKINTLLRCPALHYMQFVECIKVESRSALLKGISFHKAESGNYEQKIVSHADMPISDVLDIFSTSFDSGSTETLWFPDEDAGKIKDSGYDMLSVYHKEIAPIVQPISVETPFELTLKGTDQVFAGRVDVIQEDDIIRDMKTRRAKPSFVEGNEKLQMSGYSAGFQVQYKRKPKKIMLDYAIDKKQPECLSYEVDVTDSDIDLLLNLIGMYQKALKDGLEMPNRGNVMCSRRYCQYSELCMKKYGGTIKQ